MNVLILGIDGYLGWPLALYLKQRGHEVHGLDNFSRRRRVKGLGCESLTPITDWLFRSSWLRQHQPDFHRANITLGENDPSHIRSFLEDVKPDAIVHLAEQPSAPWSMRDVYNASATQIENIIGTLHLLWAMHEVCPNAHLIKLGTMGEYGTPDCDIPEGEIPLDPCLYVRESRFAVEDRDDTPPSMYPKCPMSGLQFPRKAGSWYHLTKVHDSFNIEFACRNWGLQSTDIMQGPVFGVRTTRELDEDLITRFDYDEQFGTIINRFCAQAVADYPLTVYGEGGQTRGYLPIRDSMYCITLALENPPAPREYRVFNQFERTYTANELATIVQIASKDHGLGVKINHYENPRKEAEVHYYNPHRQKLVDLGYQPTTDITPAVSELIGDILPYKDRIKPHLIIPETRWDTHHRESNVISH